MGCRVPARYTFGRRATFRRGAIFISSGYYSNRLAFAPPLVISEDDLRAGLAVLDDVLGQAEKRFHIGK